MQSSTSHRLQSGPQAQASTGDNFPLKQTQINTDSSIIEASTPGPAPPWKCPFTEDIGYLVFSSTVSFYGPLAVMVFTYIRIYQVRWAGEFRPVSFYIPKVSMFLSQAATAYSKSLTSGTKQLGGGGSGEGEITLR